MEGSVLAFVIWSLVGCFFFGMGVYSRFSKKAVGFWANQPALEVTDVKKYNVAMTKLFCTMGIGFVLLGLPLLEGQNSAWIVISILGVMFESILAMVIYLIVIEKKYKKV